MRRGDSRRGEVIQDNESYYENECKCGNKWIDRIEINVKIIDVNGRWKRPTPSLWEYKP